MVILLIPGSLLGEALSFAILASRSAFRGAKASCLASPSMP
jgi:hypothetical protein